MVRRNSRRLHHVLRVWCAVRGDVTLIADTCSFSWRAHKYSLLFAALTVVAWWSATAEAQDAQGTSDVHPFLSLRTSLVPNGVIFNHANSSSSVNVGSPSTQQLAGASVGADWSKYWGAELAIDTLGTDISSAGFGKISDYTIWTGMAQARFRYPIPSWRLQPYAVIGAGLTVAEANDRNISNSNAVQFNGRLDTSFVAGLGIGLEYFLANNIALGFEVKQRLFARTDVQYQGGTEKLNLDSTAFSLGLRMYLDDGPGVAAPPSPSMKPADSDEFRGYLALRAGAGFVPDGGTDIGVTAKSSGIWAGSASAGVNFDKYWGAELAGDYSWAHLEAPPFGDLSKFSYWTILAQGRLRYPMWDDRLSPYLVVGGGIGIAEVTKRRIPTQDFPLQSGTTTAPVGSVGAGFDYFLARNFAVGIEAKHIIPFRPEITVDGQTSRVHLDPVLLTAGVRVFFP